MKERFAKGLDRVDRVGGKVVARFWGTLVAVAVTLVLVPMLVWALVNGEWLTAVVVLGAAVVVVSILVKYLFSSSRRLSDFE